MSTVALAATATADSRGGLVLALARQEARRLLLHPVALLAFGFYVVAVAVQWPGWSPRTTFEATCLTLSFFPGVPLILAANLAATREHRAGSDELLAPLPGRAQDRWAALSLAALAPALLGVALQLTLHAANLAAGRYPGAVEGAADVVAPDLWQLLAGPVTLLGACLLGSALGLWLPGRTAAVVAIVALVVADAWVEAKPSVQLLGLAVGWADWGVSSDAWVGQIGGSSGRHLAYLLALCGLAAGAGWLKVAHRRRGPLLAGAGFLLAAALAGVAQLP
ncbi:MAG TPA: hypothetical protein VFS29_12375 [Motilibacteraceae bacterium]|nr:hypothetical protein [Motilibacteraceae bacterium]